MYSQARQIEPLFENMDNIDKYVFLMSNLQKSVVHYLVDAIALRTDCLTISLVNLTPTSIGPFPT